MPPGKLAAQAGHAFLDAFLAAPPDRQSEYRDPGHGTKVALRAATLEELLWAQAELAYAGIPHALIQDAGHILPPHFDGAPIVTALGFGPCRREEVRQVTRRFALVP